MGSEVEQARAILAESRSRFIQFEAAAAKVTDHCEEVDQNTTSQFHELYRQTDEWTNAAKTQLREAQSQNQKKLGTQEGRIVSILSQARLCTRLSLLTNPHGQRSLPQLTHKHYNLLQLASSQGEVRIPAFRVTAKLPDEIHLTLHNQPTEQSSGSDKIPQMVRVWIYEIPGSLSDLQKKLPPHRQPQRMGRRGRREGQGEMEMPCGIAIHPQTQEIYVVDTNLSRVLIFGPDLAYRRTVGSYGHGPGQLNGPTGIGWSPDGETLVIVESRSHRVHLYNKDEQFVRLIGSVKGADPGLFNYPTHVAFDPTPGGAFYVADQYNHRVQKFAPDGRIITVFPMPVGPDPRQKTMSVAVIVNEILDQETQEKHYEPVLLVADFAGEAVRVVDVGTGQVQRTIPTPACSAWSYLTPGPEGSFFLSATNENMVHVIDAKQGNVCFSFAAQNPVGVAFDADGRLFVVESARGCATVY